MGSPFGGPSGSGKRKKGRGRSIVRGWGFEVLKMSAGRCGLAGLLVMLAATAAAGQMGDIAVEEQRLQTPQIYDVVDMVLVQKT